MNLQEMLNYRTTCFVHEMPMSIYVRPELRTYDLISQITNDGIAIWGKHNKPFGGVHINFDGTYKINKNQRNLRMFLEPPIRIGMMCSKCRSTPYIHDATKTGKLIVSSLKCQSHFYTFYLCMDDDTLSGKYEIKSGIEMITYHTDDKLYHMSGQVEGGPGILQMATYANTSIADMLNGMMDLNVPFFNPSNIKSMDQIISKIKLYNTFS